MNSSLPAGADAAPAPAPAASPLLVSCIMVTADRGALAARAIRCFARQTHPHRELVVLDDGREEIGPVLAAHAGGAPVASPPLPAGPLRGDRAHGSLAIELDVRGEHRDGADGGSGGVRLRLGLGGALGFAGGVDLRAGYLGDARYEADLHALGVGWRGGGLSVALTGGVGVGGLRGAGAIRLPAELAVEASLGPTRLLARAGVAWELRGPGAAAAVGFADEARALVGIRLGRDVAYWSSVRAGAGPYLAATFTDVAGSRIFGVAIGGQLWGAN